MSTAFPTRPRLMSSPQRRGTYAIVAGQYNPTYVRGLIDNCRRELEAILAGVSVAVYEVPGSFEIPVVVQEVATRGGVDAIIALGVVMQGATLHAELIARSVTNALMDCALRFRIPVINEVLTVLDEQQAEERCLGTEMNRGIEAARAAVRISQVLAEFKTR